MTTTSDPFESARITTAYVRGIIIAVVIACMVVVVYLIYRRRTVGKDKYGGVLTILPNRDPGIPM